MTRDDLTSELDVVVVETATLSKKDRDRLVDAIADFVVDELGIELEEVNDVDDPDEE